MNMGSYLWWRRVTQNNVRQEAKPTDLDLQIPGHILALQLFLCDWRLSFYVMSSPD